MTKVIMHAGIAASWYMILGCTLDSYEETRIMTGFDIGMLVLALSLAVLQITVLMKDLKDI